MAVSGILTRTHNFLTTSHHPNFSTSQSSWYSVVQASNCSNIKASLDWLINSLYLEPPQYLPQASIHPGPSPSTHPLPHDPVTKGKTPIPTGHLWDLVPTIQYLVSLIGSYHIGVKYFDHHLLILFRLHILKLYMIMNAFQM